MASNDEIELLGEATPEDLKKFEDAKKVDEAINIEVKNLEKEALVNNEENLSEEALRIKRANDEEILKVQSELNEFIVSEENKPDEPEPEPVAIEEPKHKVFQILDKIFKPFITTFKKFMIRPIEEKLAILKSIAIILLVLMTVILAYICVQVANQNKKLYTKLELPSNNGKSSSYIFTDKTVTIGDLDIKLNKVLIDGKNSIFYFDTPLDFDKKYRARLVDENGKIYEIDEHIRKTSMNTEKNKAIPFDPLKDGIRVFKMEIFDIETGDIYHLNFEFNRLLKKNLYLDMYNYSINNDADISIERISSSDVGTFLNYSLHWKSGSSYYLGIDNYGNKGTYLYENTEIIPSKTNDTLLYDFSEKNTFLIEGVYMPIKSYESILKLVIDNVYKIFPIYEVYDGLDMVKSTLNKEIDLGDGYVLVIEGMQFIDQQAVIVYHVNNIYFNEKSSSSTPATYSKSGKPLQKDKAIQNNGDRFLALVDATITITNSNGKKVYIQGDNTAGYDGGDIFFDDPLLGSVDPSGIDIVINSVKVKEAVYTIFLDLSRTSFGSSSDAEILDAISDIKKSFTKRLAYKSAELPKSALTGFSSEILDGKIYEKYYTPIDIEKKANYSARVISIAIQNNQIFAVVQEDWSAESDNKFIHSTINHNIIYDLKQKLIISDNVNATVIK